MSLLSDGFVVVPGPVSGAGLQALARAYDEAVASADPPTVGHGSTSVRVGDLVNASACFDPLFVHEPLLRAAREVIGQAFKLSAFHARSVRPHAAAQRLHQDFPPLADGWPMVGFIFMVDAFRPENSATRFVPGSQFSSALPLVPEEVSACGPAGSMILYNGSVWHGHGANLTGRWRRSIQGALIRFDQAAAVDHAGQLRPETAARLSPTARTLLGLPATQAARRTA